MNSRVNPDRRLPRLIAASGILALGTLILTAHGNVPLAYVYIAVLLGTYFNNSRIENGSPLRWFLRIAYIGIAYASSRAFDTSNTDYALLPAWMRSFFGLVYGGEMLVQAWSTVPNNPRAPLFTLFLSGVVFLTACNTFDDVYIRVVTPLFILTLLLALRSYHSQPNVVAEPTERSLRVGRLASRLRWVGVAAALLLGLIGFLTFNNYKGDLTEWGNNFLGQRLERRETTLMAEQPSLGRTFGLRGSPMRVLRITGTEGYAGDPHLRGMAFDTYKDGAWGPPVSGRPYQAPNAETDLRLPTGPNDPPIGMSTIIQVTRLVRGNRLVYAPLNVSEVDLTDAERIRWSPETGGPISTSAPPPFTYTLSVPANERIQGILAEKLTPQSRRRYLEIPDTLDPKVKVLAKEVTRDAKQPAEKIEAIVSHLVSNHEYSLTVDPGPGDPVSGFLLSDPPKGAHCEYFAASAALLLRCVGIPTRYVTGYYVHEADGKDTAIVRQRDAHAWTEAWVNGIGWVTVDATPGNGRPDFQPEPIAQGQAFWERIQDAFQSVRDWLGDLKPEQINFLVGSLTVVTLLGGGFYLLVQRRRNALVERIPGYDAYAGADARLAALAARFEKELTRRGVPFPENRTWQEHLSSLANLDEEGPLPTTVALARQFVPLYERARFGTLLRETEDASAAMNEMQNLLVQIEALPADTGGKRPAKGISTPAA